jgi:hypothetical protein
MPVVEGKATRIKPDEVTKVLPGSVKKILKISWDNGVIWDEEMCRRKIHWYTNHQLGVDIPTRALWRTYKIKILTPGINKIQEG